MCFIAYYHFIVTKGFIIAFHAPQLGNEVCFQPLLCLLVVGQCGACHDLLLSACCLSSSNVVLQSWSKYMMETW